MPGMVAMDHIAMVDALQFGTARDQTTIAAALSFIGANPAMLVLSKAGDGIWTLSSNLNVPVNVIWHVPAGVTVNRPAGVTLTLNGPTLIHNPNWETGTGITQRGVGSAIEMSSIKGFNIQVNRDGEGIRLTSTSTSNYISLTTFQGTSIPAIQFVRTPGVDAGNWEINNALSNHEWTVCRPNGLPRMALNDIGLWLSQGASYTSPAHLLHLALDDAFKPNDGSWDFPSDQRLKVVQRDATEGLAELQAMPTPVWFLWNGKGGTDASAPEQIGWIAQDTVGVAPYLFKQYDDKLDPADADPTTLYSANYSPLVPMLVNAVKELAQRVAALEAALPPLARTTDEETHIPPSSAKKRSR